MCCPQTSITCRIQLKRICRTNEDQVGRMSICIALHNTSVRRHQSIIKWAMSHSEVLRHTLSLILQTSDRSLNRRAVSATILTRYIKAHEIHVLRRRYEESWRSATWYINTDVSEDPAASTFSTKYHSILKMEVASSSYVFFYHTTRFHRRYSGM
jgi:hypothetical protein